MRIIVADDDHNFRKEIVNYFTEKDGYDVVGEASDGKTCIDMVEQTDADVLLLDMIMPHVDGFGVLNAIKNKDIDIIALSRNGQDEYVDKTFSMGASFFQMCPFDMEELRIKMDFLSKNKMDDNVKTTTRRRGYSKLEERLSNIFISVGIPAHIKGYQFLRDAVKLAVDDPSMINGITSRLYPKVAELYETSPSKVERAIRHAIEVAWNRGKIENINQIFGIRIYGTNDKPTNGEFIALVADKMLMETMM